jgi:hypothetical protein
VKWYRRLPRWGQFLVTLVVGCAIFAVLIAWYFVSIGALEWRDFLSPTTVDPLPSYDESYTLSAQDELTEEDLAYYLATKLPDEYHDMLLGVRLEESFDAEQYAYDGAPVEKEGTALVLRVYWKVPHRFGCIYFSEAEAVPPASVLSEWLSALNEHSDYLFSQLRFEGGGSDVGNGTIHVRASEGG